MRKWKETTAGHLASDLATWSQNQFTWPGQPTPVQINFAVEVLNGQVIIEPTSGGSVTLNRTDWVGWWA